MCVVFVMLMWAFDVVCGFVVCVVCVCGVCGVYVCVCGVCGV